jgi:CheY-like chemotaxis protein
MNILIVDDERNYRDLLKECFEAEKWTVFLAENGEEGLKKLGEAKIDAIISDIFMPVMNGIKFRDEMRENPNYANLPFLFVSGYSDNYTLNAVRFPKLEVFIEKTKPFSEIKAWVEFLTTPIESRNGPSPIEKLKTNPPFIKRNPNERRR